MPCYNEQETILLLLNAIYTQTIPHSDLEVIIADGLSTDQTRSRIAEFQHQHPDLELIIVDNPLRVIPSALNRAIEAARGEIIVRMDAHSVPAPDYIERCLADLQAGYGTSVGGVWKIMASRETWIARAIAVAAAHPLGVGDAFYRLGGTARSVDTVPFGAFQRDLVNQIGFFDESLLTNEDYEFNTRIRQAGGVIWLDPQNQFYLLYSPRSYCPGTAICTLRFLESPNASPLPWHTALAADSTSFICVEPGNFVTSCPLV